MAAAVAISNTVKYGIIGVGMMGREHLINLHHLRTEGVAVVAIADPHVPSQDLALQLAQSFNWPLKVLLFCIRFHIKLDGIFFFFFWVYSILYFYSQYCCLINWINDGHMNFGILNVVVLLATTHIITKHSSPNEYILFFRGSYLSH